MELWRYIFSIRIAKGFIYKSFASLCCGYLGDAPSPYVQDIILNLPNPYFRSSTILLDTSMDCFTSSYLNCGKTYILVDTT